MAEESCHWHGSFVGFFSDMTSQSSLSLALPLLRAPHVQPSLMPGGRSPVMPTPFPVLVWDIKARSHLLSPVKNRWLITRPRILFLQLECSSVEEVFERQASRRTQGEGMILCVFAFVSYSFVFIPEISSTLFATVIYTCECWFCNSLLSREWLRDFQFKVY